nr:glycosyltransferase [Providencia rettgeri]
MLVRQKLSDNWSISGPLSKLDKFLSKIRIPIGGQLGRLQHSTNINFHSGNWLPSNWAKKINSSDIDIVNLHWVAGETMSIEDIGRLKKPIVWSLHDMWPFCGTEHITDYGDNARWKLGYSSKNRNNLDQGLDLDLIAWKRKFKSWKNLSMHIIAPSEWMAECAKNSTLFRNYPVSVIPNTLDINIFKPLDKKYCRNILNLPENKKIILFGAMSGGKDPNKGYDLLLEALNNLSSRVNREDILCVIFGQTEPEHTSNIPFETKWLGHIHDNETLTLIYNSASVMVVPSKQEAFGQTASESLSCGTPVVAFETTGIKDVVEHLKTGYLAKKFNTLDLADGILEILTNKVDNKRLSFNARKVAINNWSGSIVTSKYHTIYDSIISNRNH